MTMTCPAGFKNELTKKYGKKAGKVSLLLPRFARASLSSASSAIQ